MGVGTQTIISKNNSLFSGVGTASVTWVVGMFVWRGSGYKFYLIQPHWTSVSFSVKVSLRSAHRVVLPLFNSSLRMGRERAELILQKESPHSFSHSMQVISYSAKRSDSANQISSIFCLLPCSSCRYLRVGRGGRRHLLPTQSDSPSSIWLVGSQTLQSKGKACGSKEQPGILGKNSSNGKLSTCEPCRSSSYHTRLWKEGLDCIRANTRNFSLCVRSTLEA